MTFALSRERKKEINSNIQDQHPWVLRADVNRHWRGKKQKTQPCTEQDQIAGFDARRSTGINLGEDLED